jgi:putative ABC transport system substrate-binding protein
MRRREFIAGLGSAAAWPVVARAQRPKVPVIGFLSWDFPRPNAEYAVAFRQGLAAAGYVDGQNVTIEYRWANSQGAALKPLAEELVRRPVDVIFAVASNTVADRAKSVTSTIPIVFVYGADPVKSGLVASLNRPGGNMTGVASFYGELGGKRLGLLCEAVPHAMTFAFLSLGPPNYARYEEQRSDVLAAARRPRPRPASTLGHDPARPRDRLLLISRGDCQPG